MLMEIPEEMKRKFGLIGYPLTHSFSPGYFARKFTEEEIADAQYDLYPLSQIDEFTSLKDIVGLNVTIPYKEQVIPYLDELSDEAKSIGAVNTIHFIDGKKVGYNTDVIGFKDSLEPLLNKEKETSALVLGTGGAAKAVWYVLEQLKIPFYKVSRTKGDISYADITSELIRSSHLIVNTTPLGMSPNIDAAPELPYDALSSQHLLYDLIYNPEKTLFLKQGEIHQARIKNGLEMLILQAEASWKIWNTKSL